MCHGIGALDFRVEGAGRSDPWTAAEQLNVVGNIFNRGNDDFGKLNSGAHLGGSFIFTGLMIILNL